MIILTYGSSLACTSVVALPALTYRSRPERHDKNFYDNTTPRTEISEKKGTPRDPRLTMYAARAGSKS